MNLAKLSKNIYQNLKRINKYDFYQLSSKFLNISSIRIFMKILTMKKFQNRNYRATMLRKLHLKIHTSTKLHQYFNSTYHKLYYIERNSTPDNLKNAENWNKITY